MSLVEKDIDVFFSDFAVEVNYMGKKCKGIITSEYELAHDMRGWPGVEVYDVYLTLKHDVNPKHGDWVEVKGKRYVVQTVQHTQSGTVVLGLTETE